MEQRGRGRDVPEGKEQKEEGWNGKDTKWVFTGHDLILHENTHSTGLHYVVVCVCVLVPWSHTAYSKCQVHVVGPRVPEGRGGACYGQT